MFILSFTKQTSFKRIIEFCHRKQHHVYIDAYRLDLVIELSTWLKHIGLRPTNISGLCFYPPILTDKNHITLRISTETVIGTRVYGKYTVPEYNTVQLRRHWSHIPLVDAIIKTRTMKPMLSEVWNIPIQRPSSFSEGGDRLILFRRTFRSGGWKKIMSVLLPM